MTTEAEPGGPAREGTVVRNRAPARWFHAAVYLSVLVLMATGWWLTLGREGDPSLLARATGFADAEIHTVVGWVLAGLAVAGLAFGPKGLRALVVDSARLRRSDLRWFARWPKAVFTGRFARHEGRFDPGQRIANLVMVALLSALVVSGVGLWAVSGGPAFVWFNRVHRWSTYAFTPVVLGHILIAAGVLPGYRGVWRAMHLGGRLRRRDAARVWPGWLERRDDEEGGRRG
ncbi:cytochrome b/b6 domain-containing protein [Glycomyces paridis]|uniref:Cytochrome b/b6 domain-containing protein n=1 Tax=Glycomyces paridis TaxID=2126555 RepID=A0A4S8P9S4_9ACTN|nr:cytochrome b/b6 domain-containing protein [Glycomyces paridis]THV24569.1 cytochrome b/b6 domain-containing protein [Glycomyces paridis]